MTSNPSVRSTYYHLRWVRSPFVFCHERKNLKRWQTGRSLFYTSESCLFMNVHNPFLHHKSSLVVKETSFVPRHTILSWLRSSIFHSIVDQKFRIIREVVRNDLITIFFNVKSFLCTKLIDVLSHPYFCRTLIWPDLIRSFTFWSTN